MTKSILIGIAIGTFLAGLGIGYAVFHASQPTATMVQDPTVEALA
jgi:hypothetical protein